MPKQDWTINTLPAAAGDVYGLAFTNSQRLTYSTEAPHTHYGLGVVQGAADNTIKLGLTASADLLGITMRENKLESATRPGDGTVLIPKGQPLAVMLDGPINVLLKTATTDATIGVNAAGEFGVGAGYFTVNNVRALRFPAAAGTVVPVMVVMQPLPKP